MTNDIGPCRRIGDCRVLQIYAVEQAQERKEFTTAIESLGSAVKELSETLKKTQEEQSESRVAIAKIAESSKNTILEKALSVALAVIVSGIMFWLGHMVGK